MQPRVPQPTLRESLIRLLQRSHGDIMNVLQVADQANWNALRLENWQERNRQCQQMFAQVCPEFTDGSEEADAMGNFTFINAGLMSDQHSTGALLKALQQESSNQTSSAASPPTPTTPTPPTSTPPLPPATLTATPPATLPATSPSVSLAPMLGALVLRGLGKLVPLLAVAGVSIAAARYFTPETKFNAYDIEAIPYTP